MTKPKTTDETIETTAKTVTKKPAAKKVAKATEEKAETVKAPVKRVTKKAVEATEETVEKVTAEKKPATKKVAKATEKIVEKATSPESIESQATKTETAKASDTTKVQVKDTDASKTTPSGKPTFKDFNLKPGLQQAIDKLGYTTPTQIQAEVWNAAMEGTNIVGQSQTGTGKTTAFLLPILQAIDNKNRFPQVLIVAPTRELVQQIREDIMKLTEFYPMRSLCVIGGRKLMFQKEDLKYGPQFLVATPGRLIEFIQKRLIDTSKISHFILDEVDRMLDMGFIEDVDRIWEQLNNLKQTMTFSATINTEIKDIINKHCDNFIHIRVGEKITVDKINHTYIDIAHEHKFSTLLHILDQHKNQKTIIFSQTKRNTEVLTRALKEAKHTCAYLNGDLDQRERNRALRAFKE